MGPTEIASIWWAPLLSGLFQHDQKRGVNRQRSLLLTLRFSAVSPPPLSLRNRANERVEAIANRRCRATGARG